MSEQHPREFWSGNFGVEYISRNRSNKLFASNLNFFAKILERCKDIESVMELGANVGMNIKTLELLLPDAQLHAIEINRVAFDELSKLNCSAYHCAIEDFVLNESFDLVFTKGVLIHIAPDNLDLVYEKMYKLTKKYILIGEYYNPTPIKLTYRGVEGKLFKRDFAGEMLSKFTDLKLVDYGFAYRHGLFPQDDITWFLMEKV